MEHPGSKFTHSICDDCWKLREPGRDPARTIDEENRACCFCGGLHDSGIYVRENPKKTKCSATLSGKKKRKVMVAKTKPKSGKGVAVGLVKTSEPTSKLADVGVNSYASWYKRAIVGMSESYAVIIIIPSTGSTGDDKLRAEISAAVYLQKPVYLLMPKNADIPVALQAAGLVKGIVGYESKMPGDIKRAMKELMRLMGQELQEEGGNETNDASR